MATPNRNWILVDPVTGDIDSEIDNLTVFLKRTDLTQK